MKIVEYISVNKLKNHPSNPRVIKNSQFKILCESIRENPEFFETRPVLYNKEGIIFAGNQRFRVAKEIGMKEVPAVLMDVSEAKQKELMIRDNRIQGEWDFDVLSNEFEFEDLKTWGFDEKELIGFGDVEEDNFIIPDEIETDIKLGDLFQIGAHRLLCGDSTNKVDMERLMDGQKADIILTDPPYGMGLNTDYSDIKGSMKSIGKKRGTRGNKYEKVIGDNEDFKPELITSIFHYFGYCKEIFLFGADYYSELLIDKNKGSWLVWDKRKESQSQAIGSEFELLWSKQKHKRRMLRHDWFGFLSSQNRSDARNRVHPTQKPVSLLSDIIKQWGQKGQIIVDLFGGSGSTMVACEQLNRKCYAMEISPEYVQVTIDRMLKLNPQLSVKVIL